MAASGCVNMYATTHTGESNSPRQQQLRVCTRFRFGTLGSRRKPEWNRARCADFAECGFFPLPHPRSPGMRLALQK